MSRPSSLRSTWRIRLISDCHFRNFGWLAGFLDGARGSDSSSELPLRDSEACIEVSRGPPVARERLGPVEGGRDHRTRRLHAVAESVANESMRNGTIRIRFPGRALSSARDPRQAPPATGTGSDRVPTRIPKPGGPLPDAGSSGSRSTRHQGVVRLHDEEQVVGRVPVPVRQEERRGSRNQAVNEDTAFAPSHPDAGCRNPAK